ncbi:hypothetical protein CLF_109925 [Clonorchis sinensis]|uniref:ATP-binding cassette transporter n=1 Tax=Clonorchis sinensis TaxID=79923 RepID=G7YJZ0_CLOSI|nr:hypothetical protein CLF_109925 [Clonorchis sinensis]
MRHRRRNKPFAFSLRDRNGDTTSDPTLVSEFYRGRYAGFRYHYELLLVGYPFLSLKKNAFGLFLMRSYRVDFKKVVHHEGIRSNTETSNRELNFTPTPAVAAGEPPEVRISECIDSEGPDKCSQYVEDNRIRFGGFREVHRSCVRDDAFSRGFCLKLIQELHVIRCPPVGRFRSAQDWAKRALRSRRSSGKWSSSLNQCNLWSYPSPHTTINRTDTNKRMPHRPSRGTISRGALLAAYSMAGIALRTDDSVRHASVLRATSACHMTPTSSGPPKVRTNRQATERLADPDVRRTYQNRLLESLPNAPPSDVNAYWDEIAASLHSAGNFACGTAPPGSLKHWISDRTVALRKSRRNIPAGPEHNLVRRIIRRQVKLQPKSEWADCLNELLQKTGVKMFGHVSLTKGAILESLNDIFLREDFIWQPLPAVQRPPYAQPERRM